MAGGSGTRFWPRSRVRSPKQLLPFLGGRSLLQETVARLSPPIAPSRVLVVTGRAQARGVRSQLTRVPPANVLVEPEARNTAAAIALAALHLARRAPTAVMAVLPADHAIRPIAAFRADLTLGLEVAERTGALVTFGLRPTRAETGYGYVRPGAALRGSRGRVAWVEGFVEKPDHARAEAMVADGRTLWNAGIFAWRVDAILAELRSGLPAVLAPLEAACAAVRRRSPPPTAACPRSRSTRACSSARAGRGGAGALRVERRGQLGGRRTLVGAARQRPQCDLGTALPIDSRGCVVDSPSRLVALLGVEDLVVVDTADAVLVCRKDRDQDVRLVVDELRRRGLRRYL